MIIHKKNTAPLKGSIFLYIDVRDSIQLAIAEELEK